MIGNLLRCRELEVCVFKWKQHDIKTDDKDRFGSKIEVQFSSQGNMMYLFNYQSLRKKDK